MYLFSLSFNYKTLWGKPSNIKRISKCALFNIKTQFIYFISNKLIFIILHYACRLYMYTCVHDYD